MVSLALSTGAGPSQTLYWYKPECCLLKFTTVSPTRKPNHKRTISFSLPFLLPETGPLGFNRQKLLEPSKQKDNHWGENQGGGSSAGICSKWMQVSLASRGWVCIRALAAPWARGGEGAAQDRGWGAPQCHYKLPGWERASVVPKGRHCLPR